MKRSLSTLLCILLLLSSLAIPGYASDSVTISPPTPPATPIVFSDVTSSYWAYPAISGFAKQGITFLSKGTKFEPNQLMDRKTVVYSLYQALGDTYDSSYETGFADVPLSDITAPYIKWARDNGIVSGTSATTFLPDSPITRQDFATVICHYADKYGIKLTPIVANPRKFTDAKSIAGYAADPVARLQAAGIISGYPDGTFRPKSSTSRAEAATMIWQFLHPPEPKPTVPTIDAYTPLTRYEINSYILSNLPTSPSAAKAYIKETARIDYKSKTIQDAAAEIKKTATTEAEILRATYDYVISRMAYRDRDRSAHPSASEALRSGYGICHDYTIAMIALLNAQGIPAANVYAQTYLSYSFSKISLVDMFDRDYDHAFVAAFVDGAWRFCDPTWGDTPLSYTEYFDMSIADLSTTHIVWAVMPPGRSYDEFSSSAYVELSPITPRLTIDGRTVTEDFRLLRQGAQRYFALRDFAAVLSKYSRTPGKYFTTLGDYPFITPIIPGSKYKVTGDEFDYYPMGLHPTEVHFLGIGGVTREVIAIGAYFPYFDSSIMLEICAALDISIKISGDTITIDTSRPY